MAFRNIKRLNERMLRFCRNVVAGMSHQDAAAEAGYSAKSASARAAELLAAPKIQDEIARLRAKAEERSVGSRAECLDIIWNTMIEARADGDRPNTLRAGELWLKGSGNFVERREVKSNRVTKIDWSEPIDGEEDDLAD